MTRVAVSQFVCPSRVKKEGDVAASCQKNVCTISLPSAVRGIFQRGRPCPHMSRDAFPRF